MKNEYRIIFCGKTITNAINSLEGFTYWNIVVIKYYYYGGVTVASFLGVYLKMATVQSAFIDFAAIKSNTFLVLYV